MASVNMKVKCEACKRELKPFEQGCEYCYECMKEYTDKWLVGLYRRLI